MKTGLNETFHRSDPVVLSMIMHQPRRRILTLILALATVINVNASCGEAPEPSQDNYAEEYTNSLLRALKRGDFSEAPEILVSDDDFFSFHGPITVGGEGGKLIEAGRTVPAVLLEEIRSNVSRVHEQCSSSGMTWKNAVLYRAIGYPSFTDKGPPKDFSYTQTRSPICLMVSDADNCAHIIVHDAIAGKRKRRFISVEPRPFKLVAFSSADDTTIRVEHSCSPDTSGWSVVWRYDIALREKPQMENQRQILDFLTTDSRVRRMLMLDYDYKILYEVTGADGKATSQQELKSLEAVNQGLEFPGIQEIVEDVEVWLEGRFREAGFDLVDLSVGVKRLAHSSETE